MDIKPGWFFIWVLFGLAIGYGMHQVLGGQLYIHLIVAIFASVFAGMMVLRRRGG